MPMHAGRGDGRVHLVAHVPYPRRTAPEWARRSSWLCTAEELAASAAGVPTLQESAETAGARPGQTGQGFLLAAASC